MATLLITATTTKDQVPRSEICKAYENLETLNERDEVGCSWRVRGGAITRIEFYVRSCSKLIDLHELTNNSALAYLRKGDIQSDYDQANHYSSKDVMIQELEWHFSSHRELKLEALREVISQ